MEECLKVEAVPFQGFSFLLSPPKLRGYEVSLPLKFVGKRPTLVFEAIGSDFGVCLKDKKTDRKISFYIGESMCCISKKAVLLAKEQYKESSDKFNNNLSITEPIGYRITYDPDFSTFELSHWGASEIYSLSNPIQLKVKSKKGFLKDDPLYEISICILGTRPVKFTHLQILDKPPPSVIQMKSIPIKLLSQPPQQQQSQPNDTANVGFFQKLSNWLPNFFPWNSTSEDEDEGGDDNGTLCKNDKSCSFVYHLSEIDKTRKDHISQFKHTCRWGVQCKEKLNSEHADRFNHKILDLCPDDDDCKDIEDPEHRAKFRHTGHWDFMIPCKHGKKCTGCETTKYYH